MSHGALMKGLGTIGIAVMGALVLASLAIAQRPAPPAPATPAESGPRATVALQVDGESYWFSGQADCTHAPMASIYDVAARQWRVSQSDGPQSMALTFWKPLGGAAPMFSLRVTSGGKEHITNTVSQARGAARRSPQGSGSTTFAPAASGGTFTINAKTADGTSIVGTIRCDAFTAAVAEGGH